MASTLPSGPGTGVIGLDDLRKSNFELLLDRISRHRTLNGAKILEVGSAKGWFLEAAANRGAIVRGIEPELVNAEYARARGFSVDDGLFPAALSDRGPYDLIVFNDVFEHIPFPSETIKVVADSLAPGGLAVINLPSSNGMIYRTARLLDSLGLSGPHNRLWQVGLPSPHISYFSPRTLRLLVERHTPMKELDSFSLPFLSRVGLWDRIRSVQGPLTASLVFALLWPFSFVMAVLPSDVHVGIYRKHPG